MNSLIFLAGGIGSRMGAPTPKQFLPLNGKPLALWSLETLAPLFDEIIIVCDPSFEHYFQGYRAHFAKPGARRQDSVYSGMQRLSSASQWVCIHDSARPFIQKESVEKLLEEGMKVGASALGVKVKATIKTACAQALVEKTLPREMLWEIQTPQLLRRDILEEGFEHLEEEVTDDVSLAERNGHPVKIVEGSYKNLKVTTPEDLIIAQCHFDTNSP